MQKIVNDNVSSLWDNIVWASNYNQLSDGSA